MTEDTGEHTAESQGFAPKWSGRQVRRWAKVWVEHRELPQSEKGHHAKVQSLLDDPSVTAELKAYLQSNKWSMNPSKLAQFTKKELIPSAADKYLHQIVCDEMPQGLKRYMEYELFPWRSTRGYHSARPISGCTRQGSDISCMRRGYIMMVTSALMWSSIGRNTSCPC